MQRLAECGAHLLPLLQETLAREGEEALVRAVEQAFASKILQGAADDLTSPVVVAALRVAAERWRRAPTSARAELRQTTSLLVTRSSCLCRW